MEFPQQFFLMFLCSFSFLAEFALELWLSPENFLWGILVRVEQISPPRCSQVCILRIRTVVLVLVLCSVKIPRLAGGGGYLALYKGKYFGQMRPS